jgi:hypothetical protein
MEEQTRIAKRNISKWLRRAGLILGIVGAGVGSPTSFLSCVAAFQLPWSLEVGYVGFSWLVHWAILLVASRWALVGGVLLILDSSLVAAFLFLGHQWSGWNLLSVLYLSVFLLLLASGILFIISWGEGRKQGNTFTSQ